MEADAEAGQDITLPQAPIELIFLRYREHFNLSWGEFLETPWDVISKDLEILSIEAEIKRKKQATKR